MDPSQGRNVKVGVPTDFGACVLASNRLSSCLLVPVISGASRMLYSLLLLCLRLLRVRLEKMQYIPTEGVVAHNLQ